MDLFIKDSLLGGYRKGERTWISETGDKYMGHFSGYRKNRSGEYQWTNENIYKGQFCEDMR